MGNLQAAAMAESGAPLRAAVSWNLTSNHYPALPVEYVEPVITAIQAAECEDTDRWIPLPKNLAVLPRNAEQDAEGVWWVRAGVLLDITHSWAFVGREVVW